MKIIKRSGQEVEFDIEKIIAAVRKANRDMDVYLRIDDAQIVQIAEAVTKKCEELNRSPQVEEVQDMVEDRLMDMKALNLQNRTFAIIENGSWACKSGDLMQKFIDEELKNMTVLNERLSLASALHPDKESELESLAEGIAESLRAKNRRFKRKRRLSEADEIFLS